MHRINIAIDGPAGAGKSTIAKIIAKELNIIYLDTGAMYRAVGLKAIKEGIDSKDIKALENLMLDFNLDIRYTDNKQSIFLDGIDITDKIRTPEVSIAASNVAVVPAVRLKLVDIQRDIADENSVVMDGRDIGTYVLPNADFKFFLTASVSERAKRRYNEMIQKGETEVDIESIKKDIEYRDKNDSTREFAPLKQAEDAILIDSTSLGIDQVADKILSLIG